MRPNFLLEALVCITFTILLSNINEVFFMETPKKEYQVPTLSIHGDVEDITRESDRDNSDVPEGTVGTAFPVAS